MNSRAEPFRRFGRGAIVFGTLLHDADERWPGRNQLLSALSEHVPVVFLERRGANGGWLTKIEEDRPGRAYIARNAYPLSSSRLSRLRVTARLDAAQLFLALRRAGFRRHVLWLTAADPRLTHSTRKGRLLYDCADPNFLPEENLDFERDESRVASRAALTFSTANALLRRMKQFNSQSFLLPNGTSTDFHPERTRILSRPAELHMGGGPVIGYLGTIDWRFAPEYVEVAAAEHPAWTFALVGRINDDQRRRIRSLQQLPNVIFPGPVDYETGRAWLGSFDVGIIPFRPGPISDAINPVKMYMYLMGGLPVVATEMEECLRNPLVVTAGAPTSFSLELERALESTSELIKNQRIRYALANTWSERAIEALQLLEKAGMFV